METVLVYDDNRHEIGDDVAKLVAGENENRENLVQAQGTFLLVSEWGHFYQLLTPGV